MNNINPQLAVDARMPMLAADRFTAGYAPREPVLRDVSFTIRTGERVALLGANGSGKTTLLLAVVGVLLPASGEMRVGGATVGAENLAAVRQKAGLLLQNPDDQLFMPTVAEDVAFGPRNYRLPEDEIARRVAATLARLNIAPLSGRITGKLSGGEKRLVELAGVLVLSPEILLLDEPATFLDPRSRRNLIEILLTLPQTLLMATHDFALAQAVCERALVLKDGQVFADDKIEKILGDAAGLRAAGL